MLLFNCLDFFFLYADTFWGYHIAKELKFFLMESIFFQFCIQQELPELFQNPLYGCNVTIFVIISIDKDVVQMYNDKNIQLLSKKIVDKFLEAYKCIC